MRKTILALGAIITILAATAQQAMAKNIVAPRIYAFGFASSFNDTIVHFTDIVEIDSTWINAKTKFLRGREYYSQQLREYLEKQGMPKRVCIIVYAQKRKDIEKTYLKMKRKYVLGKDGLPHYDVKYIAASDFKFTPVDNDYEQENLYDEQTKQELKQQKAELKAKKKKQKQAKKEQKKAKNTDNKQKDAEPPVQDSRP